MLIPRVPSILENYITNELLDYCNVCNVYDNHDIKKCVDCGKDICINKKNVWVMKNIGVMCYKCRLGRVQTTRPILFYSLN